MNIFDGELLTEIDQERVQWCSICVWFDFFPAVADGIVGAYAARV